MKILKKKLYHVNQRQKYYKLCFDNFFILTTLLIAVKLNFSDTPRAQDNLSKLLSLLSAIAAPSDGTLQNLCTFLGARRTRGVFSCRVRRAFVDLGTVLLKLELWRYIFFKLHFCFKNFFISLWNFKIL